MIKPKLIVILISGIVFCASYLALITIGNAEETLEKLYLIEENGKYGYKNEKGKIIVKPVYDRIYQIKEGFIVVEKDKKLGVLNKNGKVLVKPKYKTDLLEYEFHFSDGLAAVIEEKNGRNNCVYLDKSGKEVLDPTDYGYTTVQDETYGSCSDFSEGLAPVWFGEWNEKTGECKDCGYGYINKKGKLVINLEELDLEACGDAFCIGNFKDGKAPVIINGEKKYINKQGEFVSK